MTRRLVLSDAALRDLDEIFEHLFEESKELQRSRAFVDSIVDQLEKMSALPSVLGRPRDALSPGLRSFPFRSYLIFMRYNADQLLIVNILHARREIEALLGSNDDTPK